MLLGIVGREFIIQSGIIEKIALKSQLLKTVIFTGIKLLEGNVNWGVASYQTLTGVTIFKSDETQMYAL